ncbi:MAG: hypothetical protein ACTSRS_21295 [Candidatus Helarchaeota archaeon]
MKIKDQITPFLLIFLLTFSIFISLNLYSRFFPNQNPNNNPSEVNSPFIRKDASSYFISSNWLFQNVIVDGNISYPSEWTDATILRLTSPKYSFNATLYFKNNATHLAILCDAVSDETADNTGSTLSDYDHFDIGFDTNYDQVQTINEEDSFTILANGTVIQWEYNGIDYSQTSLENVTGAVNFTVSDLNSNAHEIFEILIDLNTLYSGAGSKLGITSTFTSLFSQGWTFDNNTGQSNTYPLTTSSSDPSTWGTLKLASSPPSAILTGNGTNLPVLFHCENEGSFQNKTDITDFNISIPAGGWNQTWADFTIDNITAPNITYVVEDASGSSGLTLNPVYAQSFQLNNSCYLNNVTVSIQPQFGGDNPDGDDILIRVFNATNNGGIPQPYGTPSSGYLAGSQQTHELVEGFIYIDFTFNYSNLFLDISNTYNNTFFIMLSRLGSITPSNILWQEYPDPPGGGSDGVDEGYAYSGSASWSSSPITVDFDLEISISPPSATPKPSEVGIKINGIPVTDVSNGVGSWNSSSIFTGSNVLFDVQSNWPIEFDIKWVTHYEINYIGVVYFQASLLSYVNWTVTTLTSFPTGYKAFIINFSIPLDWDVITPIILNGSSISTLGVYNSSNYIWYPSAGIVQVKNMSEQLNYWTCFAVGYNYMKEITLEKKIGTSYASIPLGSTLNITDTVRINGTVKDNAGNPITEANSGNLTIYTPMREIHSENNVNVINGILTFNDWLISSDTDESGIYKIRLIWFNGLEVGFNETTITVIIPTNALKITPTEQYFFIGAGVNEINVTVFYNCTYWADRGGISHANASFRVLNYSTPWWDWTPLDQEKLGFGYYNYTFDFSSWTNGTYVIQINLNKSGYQTQNLNYTIYLVFNTTIALVTPVLTQLSTYYPDNLTIQVNYSKATGEEILTASVELTINGGSPIPLVVNNSLYTIQVNSTQLGIGTYNLTITAFLLGYFTRQVYINWTIMAPFTSYNVYVNGSYSTYQFHYGEIMNISVYYQDLNHSVPITNAPLLLNLIGVGIQPITSQSNGLYTWILNTSSRPAGLWNFTLTIQKANYQNHSQTLEIYAKYQASINWILTPPSEIHPGDTLLFAVNLTRGGAPLGGQNITFRLITNLETEEFTVVSQPNGSAIFDIEYIVKTGVTSLTIEVIFAGNVTDFSSYLNSSLTVITGGFLERYWWIILIIALLVVVTAIVVRVRRKAILAKELARKEIITSFQDVTKILHLVVIHKGTGADIFDYRIQERLDPTLLAGFIQAVKDFGRQLDQEAR